MSDPSRSAMDSHVRRLAWRDSATASAPPRVRVERFRGSMSRTVHLLGEVRCKKTHHRIGENTVPCLEPDHCPFCAEPIWRPRFEHFGPALVKSPRDLIWVPVVAVFTPGGWKKLNDGVPGPHRGRVLRVWRSSKGSATGGVLNVQEKGRVEPPIPGFDVEPHLLRLWFPDDGELPPAEIPAAVPFTAEQVAHQVPRPEPVILTAEQKSALEEKLAELRSTLPTWKEAPGPGESPIEPAAAPVASSSPAKPQSPAATGSPRPAPIELTAEEHRALSGVIKARIRERFKVVPAAEPVPIAEVVKRMVPVDRNGHRKAEGGAR